jgi:hypothetical protein
MSTVRIIAAAELLGWSGAVHWPVTTHSFAFAAVTRTHTPGPPGACGLFGCIVPGTDQSDALAQASLLAGYTARAVLLDAPADAVDLAMQAALLDIGAVAELSGQLTLVSTAGDVVPSPLQLDDIWRTDPHWQQLLDAIANAPIVGTSQAIRDGK